VRQIKAMIRALRAAASVQVQRPAAEAGLSVLEAGGDFADGVIAYEGNWLGGKTGSAGTFAIGEVNARAAEVAFVNRLVIAPNGDLSVTANAFKPGGGARLKRQRGRRTEHCAIDRARDDIDRVAPS